MANIAFELEVRGKEANLENITEKYTLISDAFNKVKVSITREL